MPLQNEGAMANQQVPFASFCGSSSS